jgi:ribosomal RNA-processing protein 7
METIPLSLSHTHSQHFLYAKKHYSDTNSPFPPDRTLFLANLPVDCTKHQLARFFKPCGSIENVIFGGDSGNEENEAPGAPEIVLLPPLPSSPRHVAHTAYIIFLDSSAIPLALGLSTSQKTIQWPPNLALKEPVGLRHYLAQYDALHPPLEIAKRHADSYMEHFEFIRAQAKQQSKYRKGEAIVDADGFTLVTRGGAYGSTVGGGVAVASKKFQLNAAMGKVQVAREKKKKEKPDFYTFQIREQKRKGTRVACCDSFVCLLPISLDFMDLRRNFEEDKKKIAKLKESRRFKPY